MMRVLISFFFIVLLIGCNENQPTNINSGGKDSIPNIYGTWVYTEYTDSTIVHRKIFDYSWTNASFAYLIKLDKTKPDSCIFQGYHEGWTGSFRKVSPDRYMSGDTMQYWLLNFINSGKEIILEVQEYRHKSFKQKADPTIYIYHKKSVEIKNEEYYFAKHILAGKYGDPVTTKTIILNTDLSLSGMDSADHYSIQIDPWEMVPQMDIITFYSDKNTYRKMYNWKFEEDYLVLSSITEIYDNGKETGPNIKDGDYAGAVINEVVKRLKKIK